MSRVIPGIVFKCPHCGKEHEVYYYGSDRQGCRICCPEEFEFIFKNFITADKWIRIRRDIKDES